MPVARTIARHRRSRTARPDLVGRSARADPAAGHKDVHAKLKVATTERTKLKHMPVPSEDMMERVEKYVADLAERARPYVRGTRQGGKLTVR